MEPRAKALYRLVGTGSGGVFTSFSLLEALVVELHLHPGRGLGSPGEIPNSGFLGGRQRRLRRYLLEGVVLEGLILLHFLLLSSGWWMSRQRPRVDDVCMSRWRPRKPWGNSFMVRSSWWPWLGWQLCVACATRLSARSMRPRGGGLQYVEAAALDMVWRPWPAGSCPVQLGLLTARPCGVAAWEQAMVCRGGGPGRWSWWIAQGAMERWKSGRRLQEFCNIGSV
jgi:hypothetical protein